MQSYQILMKCNQSLEGTTINTYFLSTTLLLIFSLDGLEIALVRSW